MNKIHDLDTLLMYLNSPFKDDCGRSLDTKLNTNPNYFNIVIDNIKYSYAPETYQLTDKLETIDILNGGTITGSIAFLVPKNTTQYKFSYEQAFRNYNIEYVANNPVP